MSTTIPHVLAPYLQDCIIDPSHVLITSTLETPAYWLVLRLMHAAIYGVREDESRVRGHSTNDGTSNVKVILLSVLRPLEFWADLGKKIGLDLASLRTVGKFTFIDGLSAAGVAAPQNAASNACLDLKNHSLREIQTAVTDAKRRLSNTDSSTDRQVLIIDGLDFLLACQPDIDASSLSSFLLGLQDQVSNIVVNASADAPLLHNTDHSATQLESNHSIFVRLMAYQSTWIAQSRPLDTGHAKDVSGVVRFSKGGSGVNARSELADSEWLYQLKGDGSVKAWARGE